VNLGAYEELYGIVNQLSVEDIMAKKKPNRRDLTERNLGPIKKHTKAIKTLEGQVDAYGAKIQELLIRVEMLERRAR
jgi:hypothetical protein